MADPSGFRTQQPPADRRRGRFRRDADMAASAPHDGWAVGRRLHGDAAHQPRGRDGGRRARPGRIRRRPHPRREELAARSPRRTRRQAGPTPRGLAMSEAQQPQASFQIEKIYVKDISLEIPNAPQVFAQQVQPQVEVQINTAAAQFAEAYFEVTVSATVTARVEERTLFLAEAVQAGIFSVRNVPSGELDPLLGVACPTILFPYLRETISDLIARGGFPAVLLSPISFEALYVQRLQQQQQQGGEGPRIEVAR